MTDRNYELLRLHARKQLHDPCDLCDIEHSMDLVERRADDLREVLARTPLSDLVTQKEIHDEALVLKHRMDELVDQGKAIYQEIGTWAISEAKRKSAEMN